MRAPMATLACVAAIPTVATLVGCSTSQTAPGEHVGGCVPYVPDADLSAPAVSLMRDVMPIFQGSCALGGAACHGDPSVANDPVMPRPFLGYGGGDAGPADAGASVAARVRAGLVNVKSREDLAMDLVAPNDPADSFLMHKIDGDQCTLMAECAMGNSIRPNCGAFMPYQYPTVLDVPTRDTVRRWIAQGAGND